MEMITGQLYFFLASFLWGILIFFFYDIVRIVRGLIPHGIIAIAIEDMIFWVVGSVFVFQMVFTRNHGILRLFFLFAFVGGMFAYYSLAKNRFVDLIVGIVRKIVAFLCKIVKKGLKKVVKPVIMAIQGKLQR